MALTNFPKKNVTNQDENTRSNCIYSRPTLVKLGTVTDLTTGGSGPAGDVTGPTTPGNVVYPP
jgi:hypothetical protein